MKPRVRVGRKLLVASIGVAAVSYVQCGSDKETVANLVAPSDASSDQASKDTGTDKLNDFDAVANLVAPD